MVFVPIGAKFSHDQLSYQMNFDRAQQMHGLSKNGDLDFVISFPDQGRIALLNI